MGWLVLALALISTSAHSEPRQIYVLNTATGAVYQKGNGTVDPASITKLATAIIVARDLDLNRTIKIEPWDIVGGSTAALEPGDVVRGKDLLIGLLPPSGNDAAFALARMWSSRSLYSRLQRKLYGDTFVQEMNLLARKLGMRDTKFTNPSGQPIGGVPQSSAHDAVMLLREALNYPVIADILGQRTQQISVNGGRTATICLTTTNELLGEAGVFAGKTGTGSQFEANLVVARKNEAGQTIIGAIMGSDRADRFNDMRAALAPF
jgi:D-alanyl-D-alanine carboxypeptidase (penicillin-binding protein 5/6)